MKYLIGLLFSLSVQWGLAQNANNFAINNLTIHTGNGQVIQNGAVVVKNGKIAAIGAGISTADAGQVIDGKGQFLYPSLIAPNTQLGLVEVEAVRATRDFYEVGNFNPHIRSLIAYNTDSEIIPTVRSNGVLLAQSVPQGGRISGQSSVLKLDGFNWEEATQIADNGVHLWFPNRFHYTGWWAEPGRTQANKNYQRDLQAIKIYLDEAVAYSQKTSTETKNLKFEVMRSLFNKSKKLFLHADEARNVLDAIELLKPYNLDIVLVGGSESFLITDALIQHNIPVVYMNVHELPSTPDWDTDQMYKTPAALQKAGVKFCLGMGGSWQTRNLPFIAGNSVAYGLSKEQALTAITLSTAQILGIDKQVGSLEVGKDATFFLSKGDVLDMRTSIVTDAYIQGKKVDLNNRQTRLYDKHLQKLGLPKQ